MATRNANTKTVPTASADVLVFGPNDRRIALVISAPPGNTAVFKVAFGGSVTDGAHVQLSGGSPPYEARHELWGDVIKGEIRASLTAANAAWITEIYGG